MAAMELLCHWVGIKSLKYSKEEVYLFEAEIFSHICGELRGIFWSYYKDYFRLIKLSIEEENTVLDNMFVCLVIKDVLSTAEYNLKGVAQYTDTPEDIIQEVVDGRNANPSARLLRRAIELHRSVRPDLYRSIIKKITIECLAAV